MNIWPMIKELEGQTLFTLRQRKHFDILDVGERIAVIRIQATGKERPISRNEIEPAAAYLHSHGSLTRTEIREKFSIANPAYVAAILSKLPDVTYNDRPIQLFYRKGSR